MFRLILLFSVFLISTSLFAQGTEPRVQEGQFTFDTDKPFTLLELDQNDEPIVTKKKKPKRRVYYGIKTKKAFTRKGYGDKMTIELFYVLKSKTPEKPNGFARDVYWYDFTRKDLRKTSVGAFDPKKGVLVHGPYKRMVGDALIEEGVFYKGTKHGRWMQYDRQNLVQDKEKYYKGWPKESLVTYYDPNKRKKIKEITPIEYGEKEGYYYYFHENGQIAVVGEYHWGERVNDWVENYPNGKRKKTISYAKEPFDKDFKPFIKKEWDEKGKEIYSK